ncbi:hypothetical protein N7517_008591 [Penicillium concentricum]|uniref:Epidermal growth factor receptor-like transmembrane-juxtamembrane segment domain-containing protein n=1 Tax=Penicillium concentricum TaxID=293559 RepID=A0A9W9RSQ3_9EURO|nr:uncharacterized protein N7517_008591 [Penicillium concentricum]KAJ5365705.1 hypothetical protein N7517_008591 [Penicillium concentricum]
MMLSYACLNFNGNVFIIALGFIIALILINRETGGVVGGVVGAAAIIAVLFLLIRRRKQQSRQSQEQMRNQEYGQSRSHVVYSELGERLKPKELDGQARSEIGSGGVSFKEPQELPVGH